MKLKIVRLDHNGYNGRDYYALDSDVGSLVLPVAMESYQCDAEGDGIGQALNKDGAVARPSEVLAYPDGLEQMWTGLTSDGRTVQLMGHEVEVVL